MRGALSSTVDPLNKADLKYNSPKKVDLWYMIGVPWGWTPNHAVPISISWFYI